MFLVTKLVGQIAPKRLLLPLNGQRSRVQGTVFELNYMLTKLSLCPTGLFPDEISMTLLIQGWRRLTPPAEQPLVDTLLIPKPPQGPLPTKFVVIDPLTLFASLLTELTYPSLEQLLAVYIGSGAF